MKIRDIMTAPAIVLPRSATLEEAARTMLDRGVGCVLITGSDGELVGILTESDFCGRRRGVPFAMLRWPEVFGEWLPLEGLERIYQLARDRRVEEAMAQNVVTLSPGDPVDLAPERMLEAGVHRLPVVEGGRPVGIVTRRDLLRPMVSSAAARDSGRVRADLRAPTGLEGLPRDLDHGWSNRGIWSDYLGEIGRIPILTAAEELERGRRIVAGDEGAFQELVRCNLRLVVSVARGFRGGALSFSDLVQEGNRASCEPRGSSIPGEDSSSRPAPSGGSGRRYTARSPTHAGTSGCRST